MTEDADLNMGLYIIVVLCLIVIAMSSYKVAYCGSSYFQDMEKATLPHLAERSDRFTGSGALAAPEFWNMGSVEETNELLQAAAKEQVKETMYTPPKSFTDIESFAGVGY